MTDKTIPYAPLPQICANCTTQAIDDAGMATDQAYVSVFCGHRNCIITAHCGDIDDKRVIYGWTVSGPLTEEQAYEALSECAGRNGLQMVINRGDDLVN